VFKRLEQSGLKIKIEKCKFMATSVNYLGHEVSSEGVRPDSSKTQCIANYQKPENADLDNGRWIMELQQYNFQVEYKAGSKHVNADALSRMPKQEQCYRIHQDDLTLYEVIDITSNGRIKNATRKRR
jgi:hypothetical protein